MDRKLLNMMKGIWFVAACLVLVPSGPVQAAVIPIDGKDPADGSAVTGIRVDSDDGGGAFLYFLCDDDTARPKIILSHPKDIDAPTKPFKVAVTYDDGRRHGHYFHVMKNRKLAAFFVRHAQLYEDRFGAHPPMFDPQTSALNPAYVTWDHSIYSAVVSDFAFAASAELLFKSADGSRFQYRFDLSGMDALLPRLSACYRQPG